MPSITDRAADAVHERQKAEAKKAQRRRERQQRKQERRQRKMSRERRKAERKALHMLRKKFDAVGTVAGWKELRGVYVGATTDATYVTNYMGLLIEVDDLPFALMFVQLNGETGFIPYCTSCIAFNAITTSDTYLGDVAIIMKNVADLGAFIEQNTHECRGMRETGEAASAT